MERSPADTSILDVATDALPDVTYEPPRDTPDEPSPGDLPLPPDTPEIMPDGCIDGLCYYCIREARNGSERCDDARFTVPSPPARVGLVCIEGRGGVMYVSTNTGPTQSDGVARCQGWEDMGVWAGDTLAYVTSFPCGRMRIEEIDLSSRAGARIWMGVHDQPDMTGRFTDACVATLDAPPPE